MLETEFADLDSQQVLITTTETVAPESDVHCRMFAPLLGVPEDPATGSAHGPLGAYLFTHGIFDFSDRSLVSEQGVEMGRPSKITVGIEADGDQITDVSVGGDCVEIGSGSLKLG